MNIVKSKEFWIGVVAGVVLLKVVAPRVPLVAQVTSKIP